MLALDDLGLAKKRLINMNKKPNYSALMPFDSAMGTEEQTSVCVCERAVSWMED